ncbi:ROK family protein [Archangium violaceum]|uniref:ROK family protein n=1 Tax=Archangium violaceum TaxID=83451 RepID=UPI00193AEEC7|nr:ROK family protein [Archangium violaceum]QRK10072.1 ROK family protein [Archangium violaceum]
MTSRRASGASIAFDIGGTWFRSGLVTPEGTLVRASREPAVSFRSRPDLSVPQLQQALVDYLVREYHRLAVEAPGGPPRQAAISMGAALDGRTGFLWNSGPLWGPECRPFELGAALEATAPGVRWTVVNDISAALLWHVARAGWPPGRTVLVTISTGIGSRTWDGERRRIPLDPVCGMQGEIGHLPITFRLGDAVLERACDCGGPNHLNAFCSGSALTALLPRFARQYAELLRGTPLAESAPESLGFTDLAASAQRAEPFARRVLEDLTRPLAEVLLHQFTLDPDVERVVLTGGVLHGLAPHYLDVLLAQLERLGLYQLSAREPGFFRTRLVTGQDDDQAGLLGAVLAASFQEEGGTRV